MSFRHAETVLEFPELLGVIAEYAGSDQGRQRVLALRPLPTVDAALAVRPLLGELASLLLIPERLPQPALPDLAPLLARAAPEGAVLATEELPPVRTLLAQTADAARFAARHAESCPALRELFAELDPLPSLAQLLERTLDEEGNIRDHASARLAEIRRERRTVEARLQRELEGILGRWNAAGVLQDPYITVRNGRHVIPVRRDAKNRPSGVVHDHSDSGRTLFMEPAATLPLGNDLADLCLEERDELRRILAALSAAIRTHATALSHNAARLAQFDAAAAIATWGTDYNCEFPRFSGTLRLERARHPLLARRFRVAGQERQLVPLDLALAPQTRVLLLSGPNSGGKTAALKTAGLLVLAAQTGLPIPAHAGSELPWFATVLADIGDEQSLDSDLSTFTGHLRRLREMLETAHTHRPALVLLDEAGTGTDPLEGGALACAALEQLATWGGITLATTHLGALKSFVQEREGMLNASVRFNPETLQPEYALELGAPGSSRALAVARRVGFPAEILQRAQELLASDTLRLETMLASIEDAQREVAHREQEARAAAAAMATERVELREQLDRLRNERRQLLHEAQRQAIAIVEHARRDMERLLKKAGENVPTTERQEQARELRTVITERQRQLEQSAATTAPRPPAPAPKQELLPGRTVWVEKLQANARILAVKDGGGQLEVEVGGARFTIRARDAGRRQGAAPPTTPPVINVQFPRLADGAAPCEINLIGRRLDEALELLDAYLDRAVRAGLYELRIVHGFGTGRLQAGIHEHLRAHPSVARHRLGRGGGEGGDPGGGGVTICELRTR